MISKVLQITHSKRIYRNFSLHDKRRGYLRRQDMQEMMVKIETLLDTRPDEIPNYSQFFLEFDHEKLARSNIHDKTYWVVATEAEITAGQRTATTGARRRRVHNKYRMNMTTRARLRIPEAEERTGLRRSTYGFNNGERPTGPFHNQAVIKPLSRRQSSSSAPMAENLRSSKWYQPGD